ncbi:uncharacterized protein LOC115322083 [Ixodes scapularis]|uniref:uncharacterized protein LOC115322083 n=1 Tax=Ixodes scapularis TaxID=6945 RepID=UPI001A9D1662|nr:uncharacterized protein LOC115322083 [Ixodes scapularis]
MADCDRPPPNFLDKAGTPPIPWKSWLRMFERFILATGAQEYSAERRQAKLLNCLGVEGQRIYDSLPAPVGPAPATSPAGDGQQARQASRDVYRKTLTVLEAEFSQPVDETLQQLRFHMRKQQEGESLRDFLSALRALAVPANFGADTEAVIRRQFMMGAASAEIQERLVLDAALPFSVALQTVLNLERSRREVREWASATAPAAPSTASEEHVTCHVTGRATSQPQPMMSSLHEPWRSRRESPVRSPMGRSSAASARSVNARASRSPSQQSCVTCGRSGYGGFDRGSRQQSPGRSAFRRSVRFESPRRQPSPRRNYGYGRTCPNCGYGQEHCRGYDVCPARGQHCDNCGRRGHFSRACRSVRRSLLRRPRDQVEQIVDDYYDDDDEQWETSPTPLQPVPLPERPWSKVGIDVVGPFERAEPACRYAITLVDYFSKWPEPQRLRHRVQQRQQYTKEYTDRRRAAKSPRFRVGDWVRVKKPGKVAKGESAFGPPLRIMKRVGRWTFRLGDGRVWNASKLAAASDPSLGSHQQGTPAAVQGGQPASHTATPGDAYHRHHTWQPQESSSAMQQLPRSRTPECRPAPDTPPGMGTSTAQCPRQVLLRRSGRNRRPPVRYGDLGTR